MIFLMACWPIENYHSNAEYIEFPKPFTLKYFEKIDIPIFKTYEESYNYILDNLLENESFEKILDSYRISENYGYYSDRSIASRHLGTDYETTNGAPIYAPSNGYIWYADASYRNYGYLGSKAGKMVPGGGNQLYMLTEVNDKVYGLILMHLNTINVKATDIVKQGDVIATVGRSGSSDSPHLHLEVYILGEGYLSEYVRNEYDYSFNVPRSLVKCDGYPCRIDPEEVIK